MALVKGVAELADDKEEGKVLRRFFKRRAVRVVGALVLIAVVVALLVALLFVFLNWYVAPTKPSERKDLVLAVAQILGGTALISGLYFTWRTLQVNREGQITERFTRAIDQLGKVEDGQKLFEIRVGGIYALERIARESEEDYWPIMEILTAYARQNAPWPPEGGGGKEDATREQSALEGSGGTSETTEAPALDPDILAITTLLRRRPHFYEHGEPGPLELHKTNLYGADLRGANLFRANLSEANLSEADLHGANLRGAGLYGAHLLTADLYAADLYAAVPSGADLSGANLYYANLSEANLSAAGPNTAGLSDTLGLTQGQLEEAKGDENTKLPSHLKPPAHWGVKTAEQSEGD